MLLALQRAGASVALLQAVRAVSVWLEGGARHLRSAARRHRSRAGPIPRSPYYIARSRVGAAISSATSSRHWRRAMGNTESCFCTDAGGDRPFAESECSNAPVSPPPPLPLAPLPTLPPAPLALSSPRQHMTARCWYILLQCAHGQAIFYNSTRSMTRDSLTLRGRTLARRS